MRKDVTVTGVTEKATIIPAVKGRMNMNVQKLTMAIARMRNLTLSC